jgi:hypothetical protein
MVPAITTTFLPTPNDDDSTPSNRRYAAANGATHA